MSENAGMTHSQTLGSLGEFGLLGRFDHAQAPWLLIGPGDDAAHLDWKPDSVLMTSDISIEGRHFRRDWSTAQQIGAKAAAVNLSDISAMGGTATALTVSFAAPADTEVSWVEECRNGIVAEAAKVGALVVGGDLSESRDITIAITAIGTGETVVSRSGAGIGDTVAYAGTLGLARAGLAALSRGFRSPREAVQTHCLPRPPYASGPQAAAAGATAMIDISDGLVNDLGHIARMSSITIDIKSHTLDISTPIATVAEALGINPLSFILAGGDDYALVATFPPYAAVPPGWHAIGSVVSKTTHDVTVDGEPIDPNLLGDLRSFEHFRHS